MKERAVRTGFAQRAFYITLFLARIALGGLMFEAGVSKLLSGTFSAAELLGESSGPFAEFFLSLANNPDLLPIINNLVMWGELLVGVALILGILVRFASFWGALMMLLYYLPSLPPASGWINQQIIYLLLFVLFMFSGAGYFLGLDSLAAKFERTKHPLRIILG